MYLPALVGGGAARGSAVCRARRGSMPLPRLGLRRLHQHLLASGDTQIVSRDNLMASRHSLVLSADNQIVSGDSQIISGKNLIMTPLPPDC